MLNTMAAWVFFSLFRFNPHLYDAVIKLRTERLSDGVLLKVAVKMEYLGILCVYRIICNLKYILKNMQVQN